MEKRWESDGSYMLVYKFARAKRCCWRPEHTSQAVRRQRQENRSLMKGLNSIIKAK
jgi:hypothetical protein